MNTSEVLDRAADLIEERGWAQGPLAIMGAGGLCIMGAVYAADSGRVARSEAEGIVGFSNCPAGEAVYDYLSDRLPTLSSPHYAWQFNDTQGRRSGEVVEVLRACAVIEASREREAAEVTPEPVSA